MASKIAEKAVSELITREEMNLAEYPIGLINERLPVNPDTGKEVTEIIWEKWIALPDGERVKQEWMVVAPERYGLPRGLDTCFLFLLMQIWAEQGLENKQVSVGSIYRMLKRMGLSTDKRHYDRLRDALSRFIAVSYHTRYAIWNPKKRTYIPKLDFNILSRVQFDGEEEIEEPGVSMRNGFVEFTDAMLFLARNGHFKATNAGLYWALPTPQDRRLFQFLDKRRPFGKQQQFDVFGFAKKLGTHDVTLRRYKPKDIRKVWEPHLKVLTTEEYGTYLENFAWTMRGRRNYVSIRYGGEFPEPLTSEGQALADEIVLVLDDEGSRRYYELAIVELGVARIRTLFRQAQDAFDAQSVKNPAAYLVSLLQPARKAEAKKRQAEKARKSCTACRNDGMLELTDPETGRLLAVHLCPHDPAHIAKIRAIFAAELGT